MNTDYLNYWAGNIAGGIIKIFTIYKYPMPHIVDCPPQDAQIQISKKERETIINTLDKVINLDLFDIEIHDNIIIGVLKDEIYNKNIEDFKLELKQNCGLLGSLVRNNPYIQQNRFNGFNNLGINLPFHMSVIAEYFIIDSLKYIGENSCPVNSKLTAFARKIFKNPLGKAIYFDEIDL